MIIDCAGVYDSPTWVVMVPAFPNVNEVVDVPRYLSPEYPEVPVVPDVPVVPELPEVPVVPDDPEVPVVPDEPEVPIVPLIPLDPDVPEVPDMPLVPDTPSKRPKETGVLAKIVPVDASCKSVVK